MAANISGAPLSAANLVNLMLKSLPASSDAHIKTPVEAIALAAHTCLLAVDFRLIGLDEEHRLESGSEGSPELPSSWNSNKTISFKYAHPQSSMQFLLTISKMGTKAVINAIALGDEKVASVDVPLNEFTSQGSLPYTAPADRTSVESTHSIQNIFISAGRIADFSSLIKTQIIQKLVPKMQKEGYEEGTTSQTTEGDRAEEASRNRNQRQDTDERERAPPRRPQDPLPPFATPRPFDDPLADIPRRGPVPDFAPPGFEDEHGILRPPGRGGFGNGGLRGPNIGERDLYPQGLGPNDPLRIGPGGGGFRGGGGGMYPAFDDPVFGDRGQQGGFNPMAPPGARYDPVGPGDGVPRDPGGRRGFPGGGGGGGMRGGPPNPFGGFGGNDFI